MKLMLDTTRTVICGTAPEARAFSDVSPEGAVRSYVQPLRRALSDYVEHFHAERNHQGKGNVLLFPRATDRHREGPVRCGERLGGLLRYYHREAA